MLRKSPGSPPRKRVRFDPASTTDPKQIRGISAQEVVKFRFLPPAQHLPNRLLDPYPEKLTFDLPFLHQIIPREQIHGWKELHVAIYVHTLTLATYISTKGERQTDQQTEITDVPALLAPFIKNGFCDNLFAFEAVIRSDSSSLPFSNLLATYEVNDTTFAIYKEKFLTPDASGTLVVNEALHKFHKRMAFLMFVHIDDASFIDSDDSRWELFCIARMSNEAPVEFVGYATVYPFSTLTTEKGGMDFTERIRISQFFISPLFQLQGHGGRLLNSIYNDAHYRDAMQITVEDPSLVFRLLRNVTDLRRAYTKQILNSRAPIDIGEESKFLKFLEKKLMLTPGQARCCIEIHQLWNTDRKDEVAYKKYRLWVKRRLFKACLETLDHFDKQERKDKLAEIYHDLEKEYDTAISRLEFRSYVKQ